MAIGLFPVILPFAVISKLPEMLAVPKLRVWPLFTNKFPVTLLIFIWLTFVSKEFNESPTLPDVFKTTVPLAAILISVPVKGLVMLPVFKVKVRLLPKVMPSLNDTAPPCKVRSKVWLLKLTGLAILSAPVPPVLPIVTPLNPLID